MRATDVRTGVVALSAVVVLAGTFLPWLASGTVTRNAYGATGAGEALLALDAPARAVLDALPLLSALFVAALLLRVLHRARDAAVLVVALELAMLAAAVGASFGPTSGTVHVVMPGPLCTGVGAVVGTTAIMTAIRRRPSSCSTPPAPYLQKEAEDVR